MNAVNAAEVNRRCGVPRNYATMLRLTIIGQDSVGLPELLISDSLMGANTGTQAPVSHVILPETEIDEAGKGEAFELGPLAGKQVLIVLRITKIVEQEALDVSIWGSTDSSDWGKEPLVAYPQKFYQGIAPAALDLGQRPEIKFLQARWDVNRWGRGYPRPYFKFAVEIQELQQ